MTADQTGQPRQVLPPVYFLAAISLMLTLHFVFPIYHWINDSLKPLGLVLIAIGVAIAVFADAQFRRHGTTVKPFRESSALVTGGVFRLTRNPMYLGMVLALAGAGACTGSLTPWFVIPAFVWLIIIRFIRYEEASLTEQFGGEFLDYKSNVRRWI